MGNATSRQRSPGARRTTWRTHVARLPLLGPAIVRRADDRTLRRNMARADALEVDNNENILVQNQKIAVYRASGAAIRARVVREGRHRGGVWSMTNDEKACLVELERQLQEAMRERTSLRRSNELTVYQRNVMRTHLHQRATRAYASEFANDIIDIVSAGASERDTERMSYDTERVADDMAHVTRVQDGVRRSMARMHEAARPRELDPDDAADAREIAQRDNFDPDALALFDEEDAFASSRTMGELDALVPLTARRADLHTATRAGDALSNANANPNSAGAAANLGADPAYAEPIAMHLQ